MSAQYQLDFFKTDDVSRLEAELAAVKASADKVRKGTYARINKLEKMYNELKAEHEWFKRAICHGEESVITPIAIYK